MPRMKTKVIKLALLGLIAYIGYLQLGTKEIGELACEHGEEKQRLSYSIYDNMANYLEIRENGANGAALIIEKKGLSEELAKEYDDGWQKYAFNNYVSDRIPLNRTLPDIRLDGCKAEKYSTNNLPSASIIMCFHNEAWTVLLRSVYSIVNRTPAHLLKEILLVDDFSDFGNIKMIVLFK